jgi:hypothetical protein
VRYVKHPDFIVLSFHKRHVLMTQIPLGQKFCIPARHDIGNRMPNGKSKSLTDVGSPHRDIAYSARHPPLSSKA